jgi:hypothetical protein
MANLLIMDNATPIQQQNTDNEHLRLLSIFHYVVSGLAALFACFPVFHLVFGLFFIFAPQKSGQGSNQFPALMGWFFVAFASVFILLGWTFAVCVLIAGRFIAARKHYTFYFVMAAVECLFMPFGTCLGVFTILVLNRASVKELFNTSPAT